VVTGRRIAVPIVVVLIVVVLAIVIVVVIVVTIASWSEGCTEIPLITK
jgi:hypothetical protein